MTLCVVMAAASSVLFGVLTSAIRLRNFRKFLCLLILIAYMHTRFIFVRSSMQENIQNVLQRNSFRARVLCTGAVIILANIAFYFHEQRGIIVFFVTKSELHFESPKANLALTVCAWFCTRRVWIHSPIFQAQK